MESLCAARDMARALLVSRRMDALVYRAALLSQGRFYSGTARLTGARRSPDTAWNARPARMLSVRNGFDSARISIVQ
jgi:hypothetical protein